MSESEAKSPGWWVSWYSPASLGGFELHWPWWRSGWMFDKDDQEWTIFVAAVRADNEEEAFAIIESAYDTKPVGGVQRRFIEPLDEENLPWDKEDPRFPLAEWQVWE